MKLTNILKKLITEITAMELKDKYYPNVPNELYQKILRLDPTYNEQTDKMGKYTKWLLNKKNLVLFKSIKEEDYYKIKEDLLKYDKLKNTKKIAPEHSNIDKFDINSLASLMFKTYADTDTQSQNEKAAQAKQSAEKYEVDDFYIIVPKTEEAACYYGRGTRWCTAAVESKNYFDKYNQLGKLWILINKIDPKEKYQFHKETQQYMDIEDRDIDIVEFFENNTSILKFFEEKWGFSVNGYINAGHVISDFLDDYENKGFYAEYFDSASNSYTMAENFVDTSLNQMSDIINSEVFNDLKQKAIEFGYLDPEDSIHIESYTDLIPYIEDTNIATHLQQIYLEIAENDYEAIEEKIKSDMEDYIRINRLPLALYYEGIISLETAESHIYVLSFDYDPYIDINDIDSGRFSDYYFND